MRSLTCEEKNLIASFASKLGQIECDQLLSDLRNATVSSINSDSSCIIFEIAGYQRPPYDGQHLFSVEGKMLDRDGAEVTVLLYADQNNRLLELEFIRWESGALLEPLWNTLEIY